VTDEHGQVQILSADDPVFRFPNEIGDATWRSWVRARHVFIVPDDERYQISSRSTSRSSTTRDGSERPRDPNVGKGRWIFVGLGL
jgi:hypothetical protein